MKLYVPGNTAIRIDAKERRLSNIIDSEGIDLIKGRQFFKDDDYLYSI
jgi:hypothetical protein